MFSYCFTICMTEIATLNGEEFAEVPVQYHKFPLLPTPVFFKLGSANYYLGSLRILKLALL